MASGIRTIQGGSRRFSREFRLAVLETLDKGRTPDEVCLQFKITNREFGRVLAWRKNLLKIPERKAGHEERIAEVVKKTETIRERLYDKAVSAVSDSLSPIAKVIENNPILQGDGIDLLPTVVGHERNRGQNAVKVLEGLGDFRRGGDDIPREGPRQPLFNLPAGSHVAVRIEINTGGANGSDSARTENIVDAETVDAPV